MKYYKVVRQSGANLHSVTPCYGGRLYYSRKRFTRMIPGSMGIFVFESRHLADSFAKVHAYAGGATKVFSCEVKGKAEIVRYVQDVAITITSFIKLLKKKKSRKERIGRINQLWYDTRVSLGHDPARFKAAPQGSRTVQAVRLKRELRHFHYYAYPGL